MRHLTRLLIILLLPTLASAQSLLVGLRHGARVPAALTHARQVGQLEVYIADRHLFTALSRHPSVEFIEDNLLVPPSLTPDDPSFHSLGSWAFINLQAELAWNVTTGSAIIIAVLDTGLDTLSDSPVTVAGWNVYNNNPNTADVLGHGTMMALIAAAGSNNSTANASVCWSCRVMPVRISDPQGNATYANGAGGIDWARTHGAKIVSMSYEMTSSSTVSRAAKKFQQVGGLIVIAAGNSGQYRSPDDPVILTVGATDQFDQPAAYSNYGPQIDLGAPGHWEQMCSIGGVIYPNCGSDGTSVSTPQVAAAAALLWTINPALTPTQVQAKLKVTTDNERLNLYRLLTE